MRLTKSSKAISILAATAFLVAAGAAQNPKHQHCQAAGGMLMTTWARLTKAQPWDRLPGI